MVSHLVMVSGSRGWRDAGAIRSEFYTWQRLNGYEGQNVTLISGGAAGADRLAEDAARHLGWMIEQHIPEWDRLGKRAGMVRNQAMLDRRPQMVFIFWDGESRGTKMVLDYCERHDVPHSLTRA